MRLPIALKLLLGIASILPLTYLMWSLAQVFFVAANQAPFLSADEILGSAAVGPLAIAVLFTTYLLAAIFAFFLRNISIPSGLTPIWIALLFGVPPVSLPVFWFNYVWPANSE
jgi:hypothetical protein